MAKTKTNGKGQDGRVIRKTPVATGSKKRKPQGKSKHSHRKQRMRQQRQMSIENRPLLEPNAAGIDVGAREMYVAVPPDRDEHPVRVFDTFTADLHELADWLAACGITTVAMESTGVYWIPIAEILEARGMRPCVVDARHMKNVPGRRTDWHECQWIQFLHSVGLLRPAFRPEAQVCALRAVMRHRGELVQMAGQHVQHMHKALTQMNLQIQHVISDMTGLTGLAIIDAILEGQRDPVELAKLRDPRIKARPEVIEKSLVGNWQPEHLFTLKQSRRLYAEYQQQLAECDAEIERLCCCSARWAEICPGGRRRPALFRGWRCVRTTTSVGAVCYGKAHNRAGQLFRMAAYSLDRSATPLGDYLRRMKAKIGPQAAHTATAHKIAVIFHVMLKNQVEYDQTIWEKRNEQRREKHTASLKRQAQRLGYKLTPIQEETAA